MKTELSSSNHRQETNSDFQEPKPVSSEWLKTTSYCDPGFLEVDSY